MATKSVANLGSGEEQKMKLRSLLLRYYPPGIMLEYEKSGELKTKSIDLLNLSPSTEVNALVEEIQKAEPLITASRSEQVKLLIQRLQDKLRQHSNHTFYLFKSFITGSYDRTCKLWDTASGEELHTLEGHRNVVYAIAFNNPYGSLGIDSDKIATGSFDKTCKLWSVETGKCYHTFRGHTAEIVCLSFNPQSTLVATGSMDTTAKLWDIQSGEEVFTLRTSGHSAEIISLSFNTSGDRIVTGSFDHTVAVWEADTGRKVYTLIGHCAEISSALFNWDCSLILTGSMDKTCMLWDASNGKCVATLTGHDDEILDSCFDYTGKLIATASADARISFNPQGNRLLTGSADETARIWDAQTGQCLQVLEGHTDEIFSCAFNYKGDIIITVVARIIHVGYGADRRKRQLMSRFASNGGQDLELYREPESEPF
ncbi:Dynein assembly factor with WDR repeat domains 1 [Vulpes lagopus]